MHLTGALFLFAVVTVAALAAAAQRRGGRVSNAVARPLLSQREVAFWHLLRTAAEPLFAAPQVAMGALLDAGPGARWTERNRFDRKRIDFVLLDDDGKVHLLVELDDRTHRAAKDAARDAMTAGAGYVTLRIAGVTARDPRLLADAVDAALHRPARWSPPTLSPEAARSRARSRSARPSTPPA